MYVLNEVKGMVLIMKYQINALISTVLKMKYWLIIYGIIVIYHIWNVTTANYSSEYVYMNFQNILGINVSFDSYHFFAQIILLYYFLYLYFSYEQRNSPEFIFSRMNYMKTNYKKMIISIIFVLLVRMYYFLVLYILFSDIIKINMNDCIINALLYIFSGIFYFLLYDFAKKVVFKISWNKK